MTDARDYVALLATFRYLHDIRHPYPDDARLRAFRIGWNRGAKNKPYTEKTLKTLTWQNLGNRLGLHYGHVSPEEQERALQILARDLQQRPHDS